VALSLPTASLTQLADLGAEPQDLGVLVAGPRGQVDGHRGPATRYCGPVTGHHGAVARHRGHGAG
jgi:hypothetical protein